MARTITRLVLFICLACVMAGCASWQMERELQAVAKDWCLTIRASQVIPVYPLTEDLEPGDIFLVTTPIQRQAELYRKDGFLPLDMHLARLKGLCYQNFYKKSYGIGDHVDTPHHWQFPEVINSKPDKSKTKNETASGQSADQSQKDPTDWGFAPRAAFPSYSFSVSSGAGFKLALPIEGVPLALRLMKADAATGSAAIGNAYAYGVSMTELDFKVRNWAETHWDYLEALYRSAERKNKNQDFQAYEEELQFYLRVVNRVYLTGRLNVYVAKATSFGVEVAGGEEVEFKIEYPKPMPPEAENGPAGAGKKGTKEGAIIEKDLTTADREKEEQNQKPGTDTEPGADGAIKVDAEGVIKTIAKATVNKIGGGTIKVEAATNRRVWMSETFARPLVIGYLGFDYPIMEGGVLGIPVATREHVVGVSQPVVKLGELRPEHDELDRLKKKINHTLSPTRQETIYDRAANNLGDVFNTAYQANKRAGKTPSRAFDMAYVSMPVSPSEASEALRKAMEE